MLGSDNFENAQIDSMVDGLEELIREGGIIMFSKYCTPEKTEEERVLLQILLLLLLL